MTKLSLSYAGYADLCSGQLGEPSLTFPVPLMGGVFGFLSRDESRLVAFHIEDFKSFDDWEGMQELLGKEVTSKIIELRDDVDLYDPPRLDGVSGNKLLAVLQQSFLNREFEIGCKDYHETAEKLRIALETWEACVRKYAGESFEP